MDNFSQDFVTILKFLLPGFVAAWIFYSLTSYPKPSQFERVIQALIFTIFIQALVTIFEYISLYLGQYKSFGSWDDSSSLVASIVVALMLGLFFSYFANNDKIHKYLRDKGISRETSFPSEWFGAFLKDVTFVVLHLHDERRLYGWPIEWPSEPTKGHFVIADPSWLDEGKELRITNVKNILIDVNDVKWVEFIDMTWEKDNE